LTKEDLDFPRRLTALSTEIANKLLPPCLPAFKLKIALPALPTKKSV
jgi:hypothetical protein